MDETKGKDLIQVAFVGGASGVGKTTLLNSCSGISIINTGDIFKRLIKLASRDGIRGTDWSLFEEDAQLDIAKSLLEHSSKKPYPTLVVDTHFGAKIHNLNYRIGLREDLIVKTATSLFSLSKQTSSECSVKVILVTADPHSLLERRRLDTSRNRELVPSDCFNSLRSNESYAMSYFRACITAESRVFDEVLPRTTLHSVVNENLEEAKNQAQTLLSWEG